MGKIRRKNLPHVRDIFSETDEEVYLTLAKMFSDRQADRQRSLPDVAEMFSKGVFTLDV